MPLCINRIYCLQISQLTSKQWTRHHAPYGVGWPWTPNCHAKIPCRWNSYNHYSCSPNESIIRSNAQALVDLDLKASGYHYVTVDCGWTLPNRTADGSLTWNPALFPSGYSALGKFIHRLGLGFGVYSDSGIQMCMTGTPAQAGSLCTS